MSHGAAASCVKVRPSVCLERHCKPRRQRRLEINDDASGLGPHALEAKHHEALHEHAVVVLCVRVVALCVE